MDGGSVPPAVDAPVKNSYSEYTQSLTKLRLMALVALENYPARNSQLDVHSGQDHILFPCLLDYLLRSLFRSKFQRSKRPVLTGRCITFRWHLVTTTIAPKRFEPSRTARMGIPGASESLDVGWDGSIISSTKIIKD